MRAAEGSKPARNVVGYQRLQPGANESGLLFYSGKPPGFFKQVVIDVQCTSHMHKYVLFAHMTSTNRNRHAGLAHRISDRQENGLNPRLKKAGGNAGVDLHKPRKTRRGTCIEHLGRVAADLRCG